jgi:DnaJ-class molecular chaperone
VKTESRVRVRGQGMRSASGQAGDLYLAIEVKDHAVYERKDDDLYRDIQIDAFKAMLGGEQTVETLGGSLVIKIPAGTSSGKRIRLRGRGMPKLNAKGEHGDLYLRVMLTVPQNLSDEDRAAIEKLAKRIA